jgi:cysteinyl-tRNA synthetase
MSSALLGQHFDIHGGGQDLQFPHHENEIAQSEGAHDGPFVNYWMHNGFVRVDNEKMSKSLGNFFTVREILASYDAEVVRLFILRAHYRSALNYSDQHLDDARQALTRLYTALKAHAVEAGPVDWTNNPYAARFKEAMDDDFNTPEAVAVLFDLANEVNRGSSRGAAVLLRSLASTLGLLQRDPTHFLQGRQDAVITSPPDSLGTQSSPTAVQTHSQAQIEELIAARAAARKAKNFSEGDRIRKELLDSGIVLEDTPTGTLWRRS